MHIQREFDHAYSALRIGVLKREEADRFIPVPPELKELLLQSTGDPASFVFRDQNVRPLSQATFKRTWCRLVVASGCATRHDYDPKDPVSWDILRKVKPMLSPEVLNRCIDFFRKLCYDNFV